MFLVPGSSIAGTNGGSFRGSNVSIGYGDDSSVGMGSVGTRRQSSASSSGARSPTMTSSSSRDFLSNVSSELNDFAQQTTSLFSDIFGECVASVFVGVGGDGQVTRIDEFVLFLAKVTTDFCTYEFIVSFVIVFCSGK